MAQRQLQGPELTEASFIPFGAVLNDVEYQFELQWLDRMQYWTLTFIDSRREEILSNIRVVAGTDMLGPYNDPRLPPGQLFAQDTTNRYEDPGRDDWRERHVLLYVEPEEPEPPTPIRQLSEEPEDPPIPV